MIKEIIAGMDRKTLIYYLKIVGLLLIIVACVIIGAVIVSNSNCIDVELRVGDTFEITNVIPDKSIDFDDTEGKLEYTVIRKNKDTGITDFTVKASETGKVTLKVKDENGKSFKYRIKITKAAE